MTTFAQALGYTGSTFPHSLILKNGYALTLYDENGGYLSDRGYGVSNPHVGIPPYLDATSEKAWMLIAQRFCGSQPKKGAVKEMAERLYPALEL